MARQHTQGGSALRSALITVAIVVVAIAFAATLLPRGFSDDLGRIGKGLPAAVLIHDKETVVSMDLMELMNMLRDDYEERVVFLATDIATEEGQAFAARHGVGSSILLLFDDTGRRIAVIDGIRDPETLRATLDERLQLSPAE